MAENSAGLRKRDDKSQNYAENASGSAKNTKLPDGHIFGELNAGLWGQSTQSKSDKAPQNKSGNMTSSSDDDVVQTATEYAQAVQGWIWQYYYWSSMNNFYTSSFPFYTMGYSQAYADVAVSNVAGVIPGRAGQNLPQQNGIPPRQGQRQQQQQQQGPGYQDYRIPPIWKRVVAEFIDFLLLLLIKVGVTCILVDYTGTISDFQPLDLEQFITKGEIDIEKMLALTTEIVIMEVINRIFISIYEALCLRNGIRTIGGSTPGKRVMGLCVVSCMEVIDLPDNKLRVIPAQNIGFWNALVRSVIKNFSLAFLFPMCFTALFFAHGRAAYDIIANSIVVESNDDLLLGQPRPR
ncbi:uncharacterized protein LOC135502929 isoform X1 [Lineus longissimus]|uniref:uncharacterized protein LOC135502929 isoform X1 n=1 Tax=Lineus longissimus TaxID=88925 RepID=UPI00315DB44A